MSLDIEKERARDQWTKNPCGFLADAGYPEPAYFDKVDASRYDDYAPWMRDVFEFERFADKDVLELGFGQGTDLAQYARAGARVAGVDLSPKHFEIAQTRFREVEKVVPRLVIGDAEALPFADESFDHIHSFGVLHHSPDLPRSLREARRVLRPGGTMMIGLYYRWSAFHLFSKILTQGLVQRELFRKGYRWVMATVEVGGGDTLPLVRTYSKRQARRLFRDFEDLSLSVHHLDACHFGVLARRVSPERARELESRLGWYLIIKARKPA